MSHWGRLSDLDRSHSGIARGFLFNGKANFSCRGTDMQDHTLLHQPTGIAIARPALGHSVIL